MTLSIAGTCIGFFKNIPVYPDGAFFVSDSRITFPNMQREDIAPKIFRLSNTAGMVYAGSVGGAIYIKKHIKQYFLKNKAYNINEIFDIYKKRYNKIKLRGGNKRSTIIVGFYDITKNTTRIFQLIIDDDDVCTYKELHGMYAIGSTRKIREQFRNEVIEYLKTLSGFNIWPMNWVGYVSTVLKKSVIEKGLDLSIGGLVQTAIIQNSRFSWVTQANSSKSGKSWTVTSRIENGWISKLNGTIIDKTEPFLDQDSLGITKID